MRRAILFAATGLAITLSTGVLAQPVKLQPSALQQVAVLSSMKASFSKTQQRIDSRLMYALQNQRSDPRIAALTSFRFIQPEADGRVPVDIILSGPTALKPVLEALSRLDAVVESKNESFGRVQARMRLQDLETLAAIEGVRKIREHIPAVTSKIDTSEGDATHGAAGARGFFGTTGAGVKVCVLSDGVDSLATAQSTGDLPPVDVLPGQAGSGDEGTAMLEIVHDLAPGAELGFATAITSEASFAQNILDLAADGCDIIVDDIIYLAESPFEDGLVAQSVNTVTAGGVIYFSSAGNEGNADDGTSGTWEGDFAPNGTPAALAGAGPVHDFGDGGQSILVEFGNSNTPPILIWAEHYDLNTGLASTDYDLYVMNNTLTTVFDASTDTQDGIGGDDFPIEFIGGGTFSGERIVVAKFADGATSSDPMFNLIVFRGELDDALATSGATRGHSAAAAAFSVAATPAGPSLDGVSPDGPFPGLFTAANASESFTSDGPRRLILDGATGAELTPGNRTSTGGTVRQKPDITAADGVSTTAPGFDPFYGTSAAAPHAAAIAALLRSAVPSLTPAEVRTHLINSAIDIEAPGVDRNTGAGIIMAQAALQSAGAQPMAYLDDGAAVPTVYIGDGDAHIEPNETWRLSIPLSNVGGADASAISATLSTSTAGVNIVNGSSTYADLAVAASTANQTPFSFNVDSMLACGTPIDFTLAVTYSGGSSPQGFDASLPTGAPGTPQTFAYAGGPVAIPDGADLTGNNPGAPVVADVLVSGLSDGVKDVNLSIDGTACNTSIGSTTVGIDHTFVNDLRIDLLSPDGTSVQVINQIDGSGNNICQTVLDDEGGGTRIQDVVTADAPFTGTFLPAAPLSGFQGVDPNGTWQLQAQDYFSGDTGNIRAYSLAVTPALCDAPVILTPDITATKTFAPTNPPAGGTVVYTITLTNNGAGDQTDNPGDEFTDTLPAGLVVGTPSASSGTISAGGVNPVTWNGSIPAGGQVIITIPATVQSGTLGQTITNQGTVSFDANNDGTNETTVPTDDPSAGGGDDATEFVVTTEVPVAAIPTQSNLALLLAGLLLAMLSLWRLRTATRAD